MSKPDLSILTINWNVTDKLQRCIDSVLETAKDISYEMFVIDNNSTDRNIDEVISKYSQYQQIEFIRNSANEGITAMNKVQDRLNGRYLLILGPDTILFENSLRNLLAFMDSRPDAGAISAKLLNPDGTPQMYYFKFWSLPMIFYTQTLLGRFTDRYLLSRRKNRHYLGKDINVNILTEIDQPCAACILLKPDLLLNDGFIIDPVFPFYYNDVDICMRIRGKGYKIYLLPSAEVIHDQASSFKQAPLSWKQKELIKSTIRYFRKYHPKQMPFIILMIVPNYIAARVLPSRVLELIRSVYKKYFE